MRRGSWNQIERGGVGQFVWRFGVLWFGGLYFLTNTFVRWLSNDPSQRYDATIVASLVIVSFVYSLCVGAACGFAGWLVVLFMARREKPVTAEPVRRIVVEDEKRQAAVANK